MASPYQRMPAGNIQPKDLEYINRDFSQDQQAAGSFKEQEMENAHFGEIIRTAYRDEARYGASPSGARARGDIQSPPYSYGGTDDYGDYGGNSGLTEAGYTSDSLVVGDNNPYGTSSDMARENFNNGGANPRDVEDFSSMRRRTINAELYHGNPSVNVEAYDYNDMEDSEGIFVAENTQSHTIQQSANSTTRRSRRPKQSGDFNVSPKSNPHLASRSSGVHKRANVNIVPPTIPTSSISDAALLKRGLTRSKNSVMSKRSHGPNDPENILIVNLRENERKSWPDICQILNERRIKEGKTPSFTPNGCHNRYNRNAPILFAAEGKEFVPVNVQRKLQKNPNGPVTWDDETDTLLIKAVKEIDSQKWERVAALFHQYTGRQITAAEAALRTKVI